MIWYDSHAQRLKQQTRRWEANAQGVQALQALPPELAKELQEKIVGQVVLPGDPEYDADRMLSNPRFSAYPQVIVYCEVESDVSECLSVAKRANLSVVVRSGGHSTGGFSSQDGFLIDVSRMNDVTILPDSLTAWVGPGTNFRKLYAKMQSFGLHTPGGACPDVCVGGYMQGGGYGFSARIFGMNCDQVEAVRMTLADGTMVEADATNNRDLYWAVRGGTGSNFGVLTSVKYKLYEGSDFAGFGIDWSMSDEEGIQNTAKALEWLQANYMRTGAPAEMGYQMIWVFQGPEGAPKEPKLLMRGVYKGSTEDMKAALAPVLALDGATVQAFYDPMPYSEVNAALLSKPFEVPDFPADMTPMPPPEAKLSRYLARELAATDWEKLLRYYLKTPSPYTITAMEIYGGAIEAFGMGGNAFLHRKVYCDVFFDVFWLNAEEEAVMQAFIGGWETEIAPYWDGKVYQNYPAPEDPSFGDHYWGDYYLILRAIKSKYDPEGRFTYPQSIAPLDAGTAPPEVPGLEEPIRTSGRI